MQTLLSWQKRDQTKRKVYCCILCVIIIVMIHNIITLYCQNNARSNMSLEQKKSIVQLLSVAIFRQSKEPHQQLNSSCRDVVVLRPWKGRQRVKLRESLAVFPLVVLLPQTVLGGQVLSSLGPVLVLLEEFHRKA